MMERQLPYSIEAEQGVLGSIILDPDAFDLIADTLSPSDFYRNAHRTIFSAIVSLANQQMPADNLTLSDELERIGKLEEIGGPAYIVSLVTHVPTSGNIGYYAQIVARTAICRQLIHAAGQIAALGMEQTEDAIAQAEQLIYSIGRKKKGASFTGMTHLMSEYMQELEMLHSKRGTLTGVPTGYTDLDAMLGGLQSTDLIIMAGRPGMGKSSLALCVGYNAALSGKKVAVFSLEMGRRQLARRLMSMESKIDMQRLRSGWVSDDEWEKAIDCVGKLSDLPLWINDTSGNPIASMRSQLRRLVQEHGVDLVIVDYLQLIDAGDEDARRHENRVQEISKISRELKALAKEFDVPVLALAQLSRAVEQRASKIPMLSDLKESGAIEENADIVLFIYRDDYYAAMEQRESTRPNLADIYIAKHRNGATGMVELFFQGEQTMFYNVVEQGGRS